MKKLIAALSIMLVMTLPVMAIEPSEGVMVPYEGTSQAYTSTQFNEVLEAYGLMLSLEAAKSVPPCLAKVEGDTITFRYGESMVCSPREYHSILTAYGLTLTPDDVVSKLGKMDTYATVKDDKLFFSDIKMFLWSSDWKIILGAYRKAR